jgi:hypothetical protein
LREAALGLLAVRLERCEQIERRADVFGAVARGTVVTRVDGLGLRHGGSGTAFNV